MNENEKISLLPDAEWRKVRNKYHIPNHPMPMEHAVDVLFEADEILKSQKVKYFLSCGTALGLYRDGNFIPWDDEIDVEVFSEVLCPVLPQLRDEFIKRGFIARPTYRGNTSKMTTFKNGIKVAIGAIYSNGAGYRCDLNQKFPDKFYNQPEIYNFNGRDFRLPGPTDEYLTFYYGDWRTPVKSYDVNEYLNKDKKWRK
jgi:hypothetical protein|tara:strand:+ start:66 stop:662 length:597 start_codon:yes stop_codon:yes gene_type:complete